MLADGHNLLGSLRNALLYVEIYLDDQKSGG
jgi:hypothetical protein